MTPARPKEITSHCNVCHGSKRHAVLKYYTETKRAYTSEDDPDESVEWIIEAFILQCGGCQGISVRRDSSYDHDEPTILTVPTPIFRQTPSWINSAEFHQRCPKGAVGLIREVYKDLQSDCRRSAAMCVRAIVEAIMIKEIGDQGSFKANLQKFADEGYVARLQVPVFEGVLDAGHATIHRNYDIDSQDLLVLVEVVEALIVSLYIQPAKAAALKRGIPPRPPRSPEKKTAT